MDICPQCKEHCEFIKTNKHGGELDPKSREWDETEALSECCGIPEMELP